MSWSRQLVLRERVHQRYPEIWDLRIVRKRLPLILRYLREGESVLEVGAHHRELGERIRRHYREVRYKSLDIDPAFPHDYRSFDEISERFHMVLLFEVIEHLDFEEARTMVRRIHEVLEPGGRVVATTPNIYRPGQYWKDVSHRTAFHHAELGALFLGAGFEIVEMDRLFSEPWIGFFLKAYAFTFVFRFLGIDFAKSILLVARKAS